MFRQSLTAVALVTLGWVREPGCGGIEDPDGGTNAPCTRSSDCGGGLVCSEGVCREPDSGGSGNPVPDGGDGGADGVGDASSPMADL
ncbi:MAG TPA: hypothetical protein VM580_06015 [Labilithrix sp.]|nr:hypothetical protein [Labilithrix sp.]